MNLVRWHLVFVGIFPNILAPGTRANDRRQIGALQTVMVRLEGGHWGSPARMLNLLNFIWRPTEHQRVFVVPEECIPVNQHDIVGQGDYSKSENPGRFLSVSISPYEGSQAGALGRNLCRFCNRECFMLILFDRFWL